MKKNILFFINSMAGGGAERILSTIVHELRDEFSITLELGDYPTSTLASKIITAFTNARTKSCDLVLAYDRYRKKFYGSCTRGFTINIAFTDKSIVLQRLYGQTTDKLLTDTVSYFDDPANVNTVMTINVHSNLDKSSSTLTGYKIEQIVASIPITTVSSVSKYEPKTTVWNRYAYDRLTDITFELRDQNNLIVDLQNHAWTIAIQIRLTYKIS